MKHDTALSRMGRRLLQPASFLYSRIVRARNRYYDRVPSATHRVALPVISVGNITVGGTGKTPMVIEIARRLIDSGRRPAILTRGYKAAPHESPDEVLEFQTALPDVPVVVDADRVAGAETACQTANVDCLLLDDGFQHRRLARDLDIVLIDALDPWGGGALLPTGRLREPLTCLRRADVFVLTRVNQTNDAAVERICGKLAQYAPDKSILRAAVEVDALVGTDERRVLPNDLRGHPVVAACGIGNPETFRRLAASLADVRKTVTFADHRRYTLRDIERIQAAARKANVDQVVTTRKDWGKLAPLWPVHGPSLVRLDVRLSLHGAVEELDARLHQTLEERR